MITDVALESSDESLRGSPPDLSNPIVAQVVADTATYATLRVLPMLALEGALAAVDGPTPAKTVPPHFAPVHLASEEDVQMVFGAEDNRHFWVGNPLDMETRVCLDLEEFVKRSNGVFGKSGTGKSFLTRLLLVGILQKSAAVNLVFDMESEYGWMGTSEGAGMVKGIKQLFPSQVSVFSLDDEHSRRRGVSPDYLIRVGYNQITPEDIELLRETLGLSEVAADAAYNLAGKFGQERWLGHFLELGGQDLRELANDINVNERALSTLHNRLGRLKRFHFITERESEESVEEILRNLDRGIHVVVEFGRYRHELSAYMLVANLVTRRIHERYVRRKEEAMGDASREPRQLVITIEEAHRFLSPSIASQTTFGNIAREMRKYNVTLLVVDQRPSGIEDEVMSQLGTKLSCLLDNERDVDAVTAGVSGARELRSVLSKLDSKQQSLIFGHSVPMRLWSGYVTTAPTSPTKSWASVRRLRCGARWNGTPATCSGAVGRARPVRYKSPTFPLTLSLSKDVSGQFINACCGESSRLPLFKTIAAC